jgi:hypothetical protein
MDEVKSNNYHRLLQILVSKEKKKGIKEEDVEVDIEDTYLLAREVFEWQCLVTGKKSQVLEFVQWDPKKKLTVRNIALMTGEKARQHAEYTDIEGKYPEEVYKNMEEKQKKLDTLLKNKGPIYTH